ncbi:MAG: DUF2480 family protein [Saprospiraceae bacterium]|nr:DUF2480 family protein [Saprospiraceae bacterium]
MEKELVNRVAQSNIITLNLEQFYDVFEFDLIDLKDFLFMNLILKEKDFRASMKSIDWAQYAGKVLLVTCSADAIIPQWAYMLVASYATEFAKDVVFGNNQQSYIDEKFRQKMNEHEWSQYEGKRIVVKGCGDKSIPSSAYLDCTKRLITHQAISIMYGEPCSTVPIYKNSIFNNA